MYVEVNGARFTFSHASLAWYDTGNCMVPRLKWPELEAAARAAGLRIPKAVTVAKAVPVRVDKPKARHKNSVMIFMGV
jgi:hypothetical protein